MAHLDRLSPYLCGPTTLHLPNMELLADWDTDRTGVICALTEAMDQVPKRDEFVRQLHATCAYFEDAVTGMNNIPNVPMSPTSPVGSRPRRESLSVDTRRDFPVRGKLPGI